MPPKKTKEISVSGPKLPVSFEQFVKNPVAAVAFCMLIAVGYLYYDGKSSAEQQIKAQNAKIELLEQEVKMLRDQVRRSDSIASAFASKIAVLEQLGTIPK